MSKSIVKSVSFNEEYKEELDYYLKQSNKSKYVCELIRKDRLNQTSEGMIEKLIEEKLKKYSLSKNDDDDIKNLLGGDLGFK